MVALLLLGSLACREVVPIEVAGVTEAEVAGPDGVLLPVAVWYPAAMPEDGGSTHVYTFDLTGEALTDAPVATGPFPVVLFSHGNGGGRHNGAPTFEALAREGYVVVSPDHVGNTTFDNPDTQEWVDIFIRRPADLEASWSAVVSWGEDDDHALAGAIDAERLAVTGHSTGGSTALLATGAGLDRAPVALGCAAGQLSGKACELADAAEGDSIFLRPASLPVAAAAVLMAPLSNGSFQAAGLSQSEAPTLVMVGDQDDVTPLDRDARPVHQGLPAPGALAVLAQAGHYGFAAICEVEGLAIAAPSAAAECGEGWMAPERVLDLTADLVEGWLAAAFDAEADLLGTVEAKAAADLEISVKRP